MNRNSKLDDYLSDIAFFNGKCHSCSLCSKEFDCPTNLFEISSKVISSNQQLHKFSSNQEKKKVLISTLRIVPIIL